MCDLWKNTLDEPTPQGAIAQQIDYALDRLPNASVIKLYNNGNFFDRKAIPVEDYPEIAQRLQSYERVIVENHPKLCNDLCSQFNEMLSGQLEIAVGLETIHPKAMENLNKQITKEDFQHAAQFLTSHDIDVRTFILLNPPYLTDEQENIEWAIRAVDFAFECSVSSCTIIPTRSGNGIMEKLQSDGLYIPPTLSALEETFDQCLPKNLGRVFVDVWDLQTFSTCDLCIDARKNRLEAMNFDQTVHPRIECSCQND